MSCAPAGKATPHKTPRVTGHAGGRQLRHVGERQLAFHRDRLRHRAESRPEHDADFRRDRMMLSPTVFFWEDGEPEDWPPHTDMIDRESWSHIMDLAPNDRSLPV